MKNAFSLLGKQRFQHSAAFFLLAGSLKDAVEVKKCFPNFAVSNYSRYEVHLFHTKIFRREVALSLKNIYN